MLYQNRGAPSKKFCHEEVIAYWLGHCQACGKEADNMLLIESKIVGAVRICRPCAKRANLKPTHGAQGGA